MGRRQPASGRPRLTPDRPLGASYRRLLAAAGLSNFGDGVFQLALPLLALRITRSPAAVAAVTLAARLPWLVLGVLAGAIADRVDRRSMMVRVGLSRAALIGGLAAVTAVEREQLWMVYAVALLLGVGETLFDTSSQSLMPSIVPGDDLSRANGRLYGVEMVANQFLGPPAAGVLIGLSVALAFTTSAIAFLGASIALVGMSGSFRPERVGPRAGLRADVVDGLRFLARHRVLRTLSLMSCVSLLSSTAAFALFPVFAVAPGPLGLSEAGFGLLLTTAALGSLASSATVERVEGRLGRQRTLLVAIGIDAVAIAVLATGHLAVAVVVGFSLGFSQVLWQVVAVSLRQRITPDELRGRVNGAHRTLALGGMAAGAGLGGALSEVFGIRAVLVGSGIATLSLLLLLPVVDEEAIAAAEAQVAR